MAKLKQVSMVVSRLVNLGNYENIRLDAEAVVTVENGKEQEAWDKAYRQVVDNIKNRLPRAVGELYKEKIAFDAKPAKKASRKKPMPKKSWE